MSSSLRDRQTLQFLSAALEIVETPASPAGRWIMVTIVALIGGALVWATIGKVDIIATAEGRLIPSGKVKLIQPLEIGVVKAIHVADGDHVAAGQVLVEMDPTGNTADADRARRSEIQASLDAARLRAQLTGDPSAYVTPPGAPPDLAATSIAQLGAILAEHREVLGVLDAEWAAKEAERISTLAMAAKLKATLPMLQQREDIFEKLQTSAYAPKAQYLDAHRTFVDQQQEVLVTSHRVEQAVADQVTLARKMTEAVAEFRRKTLEDLVHAETQAAEARSEYRKLAGKTELQTLRAPVEGIVQQLTLHTVGGVVTPAEPVMVIVPSGVGLEIEAMVKNRDVGFVQKDQPVEVEVDAFNFTHYGLLHGTVTGLSRDSVSPADGESMTNAGGDLRKRTPTTRDPTYVAHITLAETGFETEQGWSALAPGMQVVAEIKTGKRRIIDYLLSPIERYRHDGLRER
ncbi:MAG TPA: HlyD family type I secretion periplasmic adaptor subunit [Stellaceae bacterium]|nr:HlyD family type I secretion periplasmic adaptor subunit [Stellaceae bacterium]